MARFISYRGNSSRNDQVKYNHLSNKKGLLYSTWFQMSTDSYSFIVSFKFSVTTKGTRLSGWPKLLISWYLLRSQRSGTYFTLFFHRHQNLFLKSAELDLLPYQRKAVVKNKGYYCHRLPSLPLTLVSYLHQALLFQLRL